MSKLLTIGYTEPDAQARIGAFLAKEDACIVDIRWSARSRWRTAFNKRALQERYGDQYVHCPALGNLNYQPEDQDKGIKIADPTVGVWRVLSLLRSGDDVMLMCACKNYETCHRKTVYELIMAALAQEVKSE